MLNLREGDTYHVENDVLINRFVDIIKNFFVCCYKLKFICKGVFNFKVFVVNDGCSPKLIAEKFFDSKTLEDAEINLDLTSADTGGIDIAIFVISDVYSYQYTPSVEPMSSDLNRGNILYEFSIPFIGVLLRRISVLQIW